MKKHSMKNYLKFGILLLAIPLLLLNCEKEEIIPQRQMKLTTVSKEIAKQLLTTYLEEQKKVLKKGNDAFSFKPLWETLEQEELSFTDALLTNLKIESNIDLLNTTRLFFIEVNGKIIKAIETKIISEKYIDGKQKKGFVFYHDFEGKFITAYKIEKGKTTLRYEKKNIQQASFFSFFQSCNGDLSLEDLIQLAEDNGGTWVVLDECDLGTIATSQEVAIRKYASDIDGFLEGSSNYSSTGEGGGGSSTPPNTDPITGECKKGYVKNIFGECVKPEDACTGGKVYNDTTKKCECPDGTEEDNNGNCVSVPTPCETALLSRDVYNTTNGQQELGKEPIPAELSGGWELNTTLDVSTMTLTQSTSGFNSAVYQKLVNGVYQYMYVTEGTEPLSIIDWYNNIRQITGNSSQYELSVQNAKKLDSLVGNKQLYFSGHSLGGGLASVNSLATGRTAFTYNAAGLSNNTRNLYNSGLNPQINATVVKGEIVDKIQSQFDIYAEDSDKINYIEEESSYWQEFFNERSPALQAYRAGRLHTIDTIIDLLDCE